MLALRRHPERRAAIASTRRARRDWRKTAADGREQAQDCGDQECCRISGWDAGGGKGGNDANLHKAGRGVGLDDLLQVRACSGPASRTRRDTTAIFSLPLVVSGRRLQAL